MYLTQFLILELGTACNLAKVHTACPNRSPERYSHLDTSNELSDEKIVDTARRMYREFGFRGLVGWHFYQEPLLQQDRMFRLMAEIRKEIPEARFVLWTNGTKFPQDLSQFVQFDQIHVTAYAAPNAPEHLNQLVNLVPQTNVRSIPLDSRLTATRHFSRIPCLRMHTEFIIDHYGNVHLCCYDWKGLDSIGNIFTSPLDDLVKRWQLTRETMNGLLMSAIAPDVCQTCSMRTVTPTIPTFDPDIAADALYEHQGRVRNYRKMLTESVATNPNVGVVLVAYQDPAGDLGLVKRLYEHFEWNDAIYRAGDARVYVVTDQRYDLPDYAMCLIYPKESFPVVDGKPIFSLTKTRNHGIRYARMDDRTVIVCTDVDIVFNEDAWKRALKVSDYTASVPLYLMAANYPDRATDYTEAANATGTVTLTANTWKYIQYEEKCSGYGCDDGIILGDMHRAHLGVDRDGVLHHIAHEANTPQQEFAGRTDHRARASGFNPDNFEVNAEVHKERRA